MIPIARESGPTRCPTRVSLKPAAFIQPPTIGARKIETAGGFDEHVEAHQQAEGVLAAAVVDQRLMGDERAARGQGVIGFAKQHMLLAEIPVVQDMAHDDHIRIGQGVGEEAASSALAFHNDIPSERSFSGDGFMLMTNSPLRG